MSSDKKNQKTAPDGAMAGTAPGTQGIEATITQSQSIPGTISTLSALTCTGTQQKVAGLVEKEKILADAGTITTLAIWDIVPNRPAPDLAALSHLSFDDLLTVAKKAWTFGRMAHKLVVAAFRAIMDHYDGRKSTHPPMKVEAAFASIDVSYEAARKLVYRDRKKRELEAIAATLRQTSSQSTTCIFRVGDAVTIADGKGIVRQVHQTTGNIDVDPDDGGSIITNVSPKRVTMLNGAAVIDGKVVTQKEHIVVAGELLIDPTTGKKWTYSEGEFAVSNSPTRKELTSSPRQTDGGACSQPQTQRGREEGTQR